MSPDEIQRRVAIPGRDRLDKELAAALNVSRQAATELIRGGRVRIRGVTHHHPARRLGQKTEIEILFSEKSPAASLSWPGLAGVPPPLDVLFEDETMMAVNKPAGLTVHPGAGHERDTLVDVLRARGVRLASLCGDPSRVGLVHRIDKDTSGILLIAKERRAGELLMRMFAERKIKKEYRAVVHGRLPARPLKIVGAIGRNTTDRKKLTIRRGGRSAVTVVELIEKTPAVSYAKILPETGRTHQIRVHLSHAGFPILGDSLYGQPPPKDGAYRRMLLHAYSLRFEHPATGVSMNLTAPLPKDFSNALSNLGLSKVDVPSGAG